jgi:hypothetical protein
MITTVGDDHRGGDTGGRALLDDRVERGQERFGDRSRKGLPGERRERPERL